MSATNETERTRMLQLEEPIRRVHHLASALMIMSQGIGSNDWNGIHGDAVLVMGETLRDISREMENIFYGACGTPELAND